MTLYISSYEKVAEKIKTAGKFHIKSDTTIQINHIKYLEVRNTEIHYTNTNHKSYIITTTKILSVSGGMNKNALTIYIQ